MDNEGVIQPIRAFGPPMDPATPRRWEELTTEEAGRLPATAVAVLPFASIEQHGPHLPLNTDLLIAQAIVDAALTRLPAAIPALSLPALAVGHSPEHGGFPGTLTAAPETLLALGRDVAGSLHRSGIRRLVLFNAHGGNPPILQLLAVELRTRLGMLVAVPALWGADGLPAGLVAPDEAAYGLHGGAVETALILHLRPDLVRTGRIGAFPSSAAGLDRVHRQLRVHGANTLGWATQDLNPSGAIGDARGADATLGGRILDHAAGALATLIEELHRLPAGWLKDRS